MTDPTADAASATDVPLAPADADRVSVLVRSMGRTSLPQALASVAAQTHRPIEVVVVNASGRPHPDLPPGDAGLQFRLIDLQRPLARATAANVALRAARGHWLLFLDDDDSLDHDHLQRLLAALHQHPGARVAHAGVRMVDAADAVCDTLDEPVDLLRLWSANRLAIHAVLFDRRLVDEGLHFDESLAVYEDWDFWFQIARRERFLHVPGASATYRLVGNSGTSTAHDEATSHALRRPFYDKWLPHLDAATLEALAAGAEHARGNLAEALRQLHEARSALLTVDLESMADRDRQIDALRVRLAASEAQGLQAQAAADRLDGLRAAALAEAERRGQALEGMGHEVSRLQAELSRALATYARLEQGYREVTGSRSWRLTAPLRRLRALPAGGSSVGLPRRLWRALPLSNAQRLRVRDAVLARPWGRTLARHVSPHLMPMPTAPQSPASAPSPPADKERVRDQAEAALSDFLDTDGRIVLDSAEGAPDVSVVIVLFNQAGLSRLCLDSLAASRGVRHETLIVDNGSTDRVPQLLARVEGAEVLRPGENLGFLRAVNLAAARARGRHLLLLNNDAMLEPDTLRHAVARLDGDAGIGAVGGPILLWDGRLQEAGSIIWRDGSCQGYGRGDDPVRPEYGFVRDVDYCSGAFLMVRRTLFETLGGLDDAFVPAYYEETDFCVRLWEQGHRIVYDPRVRIRHFEFASEVASGWAIELQRKHRDLFVQRHGSFLASQCVPSPAALLRARARLRPGAQRVLVIDDRVPLPWLGQGYPRAASWIAAMAEAGHAVTHYPLQFPREAWDDVRRALPETVEALLDHGLSGLRDVLHARRGLYDTLIVSRPHNMQALRRLLDAEPGLLGPTRLLYDAEAMFSLRDIARAALDGRPMPSAEQQACIDAELGLARGADAIVAVSEAEAAHYRNAGYETVHVLGHEVEVVDDTPGFAQRSGFVFLGAMVDDDTPNGDSVRWFVREVWPLVRSRLGPTATLHLVGACEAPSVRRLASPDVQVHGRVESPAPHMDSARVFIVPTRYAAGIPHKAHEAAARGLPMVVTPLIAAQLGWQDIVAVGGDAGSFAGHCIQLHEDAQAWQQQRDAILTAVARDGSPATFRAAVERLLGTEARSTLRQAADAVTDTPSPLALGMDEQRTADLWGRDAAQRADQARQRRHWSSHPVTAAEINRLVSGDPQLGWVAHLKRTRFPEPRARGLSLGCGSGAVVVDALQLGIVQQMEGIDISAGAVAIATERAAQAGLARRARLRTANVNELALDGPLDLIVFEQSLHHVDALGPVLDRCHDALAPDGLLVINEYVGPDRFQWSDEAQRLMDAMLRLLPEPLRRDPDSGALKQQMRRVDPQAVIDLDPSEAIHSGDILDACRSRFDEVELRRFGGTLLQFLLADIAANFDPDDERDVALLRLMTLLETELIRCGAIASDFVYAVYRRRRASAPTRS